MQGLQKAKFFSDKYVRRKRHQKVIVRKKWHHRIELRKI